MKKKTWLNITFDEEITNGACIGDYIIERTWTAVDASNNVGTCVQTIYFEDTTPLNVDFPEDYTVNDCASVEDLDPEDLPAPYNFPIVMGDDCEMVFQSHEDMVFYASGNSCIKILRTWKIPLWNN